MQVDEHEPTRGPLPASATNNSDGGEDSAIYDVNHSDPHSTLVDRTQLDPADVEQITELMKALGALREAERKLSDASLTYMKLNETDMRALHYLIVCGNQGLTATPGGISQHLGISSASTTKLLDRLEVSGHVTRAPHPTDRRALSISITPETHQAAMETVGKQQSKRFFAAARLSRAERQTVISFLTDMTNEISVGGEAWARGEK